MLTIELSGVDTATCGEYRVRREKIDPVPVLARKLVHAGYDAQTPVRVVRGETVCFARPETLGGWAALSISDHDDYGLRVRWWKPHPLYGVVDDEQDADSV